MLCKLTNKMIQAKIYTLFLLANGQWKDKEQNFLNTICSEMELEESVKQDIFTYCQELKITKGEHSNKIIQEIDKALDDGFMSGFNDDPRLPVETIWTLINLSYTDQDYSKGKKVIQYLIRKWEIKPEVISELTDTAETILLLTKQENWLKTLNLPYDETKQRLEIIEQQIHLMLDNIKTTISEIDAV